MATLLVLRHAKSDWSATEQLADADRPLSKRGRKAAKEIGRFVAHDELRPTLVLASPARRVTETVERAMAAGYWQAAVRLVPTLYEGELASYFAAVRSAGGAAPLLVVGHEPTCSAFVTALIGGGRVAMPTAALAVIDWQGATWGELDAGEATLVSLVTPRLIESGG